MKNKNCNHLFIGLTMFTVCLLACSTSRPSPQTEDIHLLPRNLGELTPQQFGAEANDGKPDDQAFNKMMEYYSDSKVPLRITIPPGEYIINSTIFLPEKSAGDVMYIEGYGAEIKIENASTGFEQTGNGNKNIGEYRPIIKGIVFKGSNGVGIKLRGTFTTEIDQCHFIGLDTGLVSLFSLNGNYHNLRFTNNKKVSFYGGYSDWPGASKTNSCFNANLLVNCRVHGGPQQISHFEIIAGDGNKLLNCISEGRSPRFNVLLDSEKSPVVNHYVNIENFWIETSPAKDRMGSTYFELRNIRGMVRLQDVQAYVGGQADTLISNPHSDSGAMIVIDGYRGNTYKINNSNGSKYGSYYLFQNTNPVPEGWFYFTKNENWIGEVVPIGVVEEQYRSQNTGQIKVNDVQSRRKN